jgi:hypothetical protein
MQVHSYGVDQFVTIILNDNTIKELQISQDDATYEIELPSDLIENGKNKIMFQLSEQTLSPKELGLSEDSRSLGLGFENLEIVSKGKNQ